MSGKDSLPTIRNMVMVALDGKGRLVIPKKIRKSLEVGVGETLVLVQENGDIRLRKATIEMFRGEFR